MMAAKIDEISVERSKLVAHLHRSTVAMKGVEAKQKMVEIMQRKLIQSRKTRWNLISDMFERLFEQRLAISVALSDRSVTKLSDERKLALQESHWQLIEDILPVLQALKCATTVLSRETNVSASVVYPVAYGLVTNNLVVGDCDSKLGADFKTCPPSAIRSQRFAVSDLLKRRLTFDEHRLEATTDRCLF